MRPAGGYEDMIGFRAVSSNVGGAMRFVISGKPMIGLPVPCFLLMNTVGFPS
jgi:hypothetical protein